MLFLMTRNGYVWRPSISIDNMKESEKQRIRDGRWIEVEIDDTNPELIEHALLGHCTNDNGSLVVKPEEEWADNQEE